MSQPNKPQPDVQPQVFAVRRDLSGGWTFTRRGFVTAAGAAAAGAALSGCGSDSKSAPTAFPTTAPTNTPDFATSQINTAPRVSAHESMITEMQVTADQTRLISVAENFKMWDFPSGQLLKAVSPNSTESAGTSRALVSVGDSLFASTMPDNMIGIYSLPEGELVKIIQARTTVSKLALTSDSRLLITGDGDDMIQIRSLPDGDLLQHFNAGAGGMLYLALSPDGTLLASTAIDNNVNLWSVPDGEHVKTLRASQQVDGYQMPWTLLISPDGSRLAYHYRVESQSFFKLWSLPEGKIILSQGISDSAAFVFSPDSALLAVQDYFEGLKIWNTATGELSAGFGIETGNGSTIALSRDGSLLAIESSSGDIELRSWPGGELIRTMAARSGGSDHVTAFTFTPDSRQLLVGYYEGAMQRWFVPSGEFAASLVDSTTIQSDVEFQMAQLSSGELTAVECGAGLPDGAICTCNCVTGSGCTCVGNVGGGPSAGGHYWYPN